MNPLCREAPVRAPFKPSKEKRSMKQNQTEKVKKRKKSNGIPLVLVILHTMVAGAIVIVSRSSAKTTDTLRVYGAYMDDVTEIQ